MKKAVIIATIAAMMALGVGQTQVSAASTSTAAANTKIDVIIDGKVQAFDMAPVNLNGSVLVPMRAIFEKLNATMSWDGGKQQVTATKGDTRIVLTINSKTASIGSKTVTLTTAPQIVGGSTMVPLRFVGEALNADVKWDPANQAVIIKSASSADSSEQPVDDQAEANIRALIEENANALSQEDVNGYLGTFAKPIESEAQMKAYFSQYNYRYHVISIDNIQVNGSTATATVTRNADLVEKSTGGPTYVSLRTQAVMQASLVRTAGEWKIEKFKVIQTESLSTMEETKLAGDLYALMMTNLLYRGQENKRFMLESVAPDGPEYSKDWDAAFAATSNQSYELSSFEVIESTAAIVKAKAVIAEKNAAGTSQAGWIIEFHLTDKGWKIYSQTAETSK
ncbi:hypothetical protein PCCS19_59190 [Paenibacillus sp. CCS19]|uniref:copper amine oxidase N-terminal domain-containing protein n=1 Tax=Paenibacillus sp. CCS19 TaxID=3158387 RepID=UPI002566309E|nr:copper amine oxidase N-terminal domain-containing protein [Paenibacillus cellulosilyticus]GMK42858.1 hypothetical protein PCCS19_59190 [Paenibacillus cellulosilyticus]